MMNYDRINLINGRPLNIPVTISISGNSVTISVIGNHRAAQIKLITGAQQSHARPLSGFQFQTGVTQFCPATTGYFSAGQSVFSAAAEGRPGLMLTVLAFELPKPAGCKISIAANIAKLLTRRIFASFMRS